MLYHLETMTEQEVFDAVCNHLLTQNQKSMFPDEYSTCAYRGPDGLKCAAGIFIPDENYDPSYENQPWAVLVQRELVPPNHAKMIDGLQAIHDKSSVDAWKDNLQQFALFNSLQYRFWEE